MSLYRGIERVDPTKLAAQRTLTEALWQTLNKHGVRSGAEGKINAFFIGNEESLIDDLTSEFGPNFGWSSQVSHSEGAQPELHVTLITPKIRLSLEAFLELTEVMMIAAVEYSFNFQGFEVALHEVLKK